ncbi:protein SMAX1-LIKE 4-like [Canna indica]|uniref:Protein SMAX1-LIKE 4-like n=1 Tax=Canna indica TaxID=4628 RepID=A0AAQ3Q7T4_9LILI|nr:protein SMAX1-LIKE 4-like [Canna indica]
MGDGPRNNRRLPIHMVTELGRLLSELISTVSNKVWLMATASYRTYVRCQMRQPSLETQWALQAVLVPSGGLALSLQVPAPAPPSGLESRFTQILEYPLGLLGSKDFSRKEKEKLVCCAKCTYNFEKEASVFRSGIKDNNSGPTPMLVAKAQPRSTEGCLTGIEKEVEQAMPKSASNQS